MELYEPLNVLKPVGEGLWVVDGPIVRMTQLGFSVPFPSRMVVVRLEDGGLFLWSPTEPDAGLRAELDALGEVRHLVSPNKLHYAHIAAWRELYPGALAWASPGVRERAASRGIPVRFERDLADEPPEAWRGDLDGVVFRGGRLLEEVVFFHRATRTVVVADLIENFEREKLSGVYRPLVRLAGAMHPDGKAPLDLRLTFLGRRARAREALEKMLRWEPERVIMAHGLPYYRDGVGELRRAFRWLGPV